MNKFVFPAAVATVIGLTVTVGAILSGPASARRANPALSAPAAREIGAPVNCINLSSIRESRVRSDRVIDFRTNGRKWYRNTLPNRCPSLGFEQRFGYKTSLNQLCSVDVITVLQSTPAMSGPSCGLGKFQPIELIGKK
jgi:hypothetical protein